MDFEALSSALIAFVRENPVWMAPILMVLAFGESIAFLSFLLPFWWMLIAIGAMVGTQDGTFFIALAAASVGAALGDWASYWIGYHFRDRIETLWPFTRHRHLLPMGEAFFAKYGAWAIVIGRFSGPLRATVTLVAGTARMNQVIFQIANWSSAVLWAGVLLLFGDGVGRLMSAIWVWLGI